MRDTYIDKRQCLYIIKNTITGYIKIGITKDVKSRMINLEGACGCRLELLFKSRKISDAKGLELLTHERFAKYRKIGEWFGGGILVSQVENFILEHIEEYDSPITEQREYITKEVYVIVEHTKPKDDVRTKGEQYVLDEPLSHFVRISKNKYRHRKSGDVYEIKYSNKQWLARLT